MDEMVLKAQKWVNATYRGVSGYIACEENGRTGWPTVFALTRALQHELGISQLSDRFGPETFSRVNAISPISAKTTNKNVKIIVEGALYCKGYSGGALDGSLGATSQAGIQRMQSDMGMGATGRLTAKQLKSLLTMDAYVLVAGGSNDVRTVQRWLNKTYSGRADFAIVPADGLNSRDVQRGLILAVQYVLGMADGVANGNFGPGTRGGLRKATALTVGASDTGSGLVRLFKAALLLNGQYGVDWNGVTYSQATAAAAERFQKFAALSATGMGDYQTWCSLLVSTGDPERSGAAADCSEPLNTARATALHNAGFRVVGRYLTGGTQKKLTDVEIDVIMKAGLRFFPIYQDYNNEVSLFTDRTGEEQAEGARSAAIALALPPGAIIYLAVDCDATNNDVDSHILPYFAAAHRVFSKYGNDYSIGVYGSRNVCSRVSAAGYAVSSFVSGMSTGFSGNLGFPLPANWAFDQIANKVIAEGAAGRIEIDVDMYSGRDRGIGSLKVPVDRNATFLVWCRWIEARAREWIATGKSKSASVANLTAMYLRRYLDSSYESVDFLAIMGDLDRGFIDYASASRGNPDPGELLCPKMQAGPDIQHFGVTLNGLFKNSGNADPRLLSMADFGGWAGDLISVAASAYAGGVADEEAYGYTMGVVGARTGGSSFSVGDVIADVDAYLAWDVVRADNGMDLSGVLDNYYASVDAATDKYAKFVAKRFGGREVFLVAAANVFTVNSGKAYQAAQNALWLRSTNLKAPPLPAAVGLHPKLFSGVARGFVDAYYGQFVS